MDGGGQSQVLPLQHFLQSFRLINCSRKTVQHKTASTPQALAALAHQIQHNLVRHQFPSPHVSQRFFQFRIQLATGKLLGRTEYIAGREMAGAQPCAEQFCLCAFADARCAQENQTVKLLWRGLESAGAA